LNAQLGLDVEQPPLLEIPGVLLARRDADNTTFLFDTGAGISGGYAPDIS
jgi:hypothetical protein